jgi:hypothetical protein
MSNDARGRNKDGRITISINGTTVALLDTIKKKMEAEIGVKLTYTQTVGLLVKQYNQQTT